MKNKVPKFLSSKIENFTNIDSFQILDTKCLFNINKSMNSELFINLGRCNNIIRINKFHEQVNDSIKLNSLYISCGETLEQRRIRVQAKFPFGFKTFFRLIDFIYKRVIPKTPYLKKLYFAITRGHNRVISKAEILGRLISCGFDIVDCFDHDGLMYVISKKVRPPEYDMSPSYGLICKFKRIGHKGKVINVYKFRTMYPYSEYCQDFIVKQNKLAKSGKIFKDYRITTWGKFMRKYWIDELPMLINFLRRDLNIFGVRPLSKNYFSLYPLELRNKRIRVKPGLIPPYYSDMPQNFEEILKSEENYLNQKFKNSILTDVKYLISALYNIFFKGARSN